MSAADDIRRGDHARALLVDALFGEVIDGIKSEQMTAWCKSPARDTEGREHIWHFVQMLDRVKAELERIATNGDLARRRNEDEAKLRRMALNERQSIANSLGIRLEDLIEE